MILLLASMALAFVLGFGAHRASICTVAAVAEVLSSRTAITFVSFLKVILWVTLVNGLLVLWMPELARPRTVDALTLSTVVGGFVFGAGAAINGGCSFSTISKIAQGNLHVAFTLPAFVIGVIVSSKTVAGVRTDMSMTVPPIDDRLYLAILAILSLWGLWELARIALTNIRGGGIWQGMTAGRYRLSTGAAMIGIGSGFLYAIHGRWAYSSKIVDSFIDRPLLQTASADLAIWLFVALLAGALTSAVSNREFSYSFERDMMGRNIIGGFLMGFGAMMVPGGNAALLLQDLPALSVRAAAAFAAMVVGIAAALWFVKRVMGATVTVSCDSEFCSMKKHMPGKGHFGGRFGSRKEADAD
jgi:hypothetical protein